MTEDIYKKLAQRLDTIPNGFPATESGVELKLLAKIFSPQEAKLASIMRLTLEPAGEIAARADINSDQAEEMLREMARKGKVRARRAESQLVFGLMPFVVGIYEEQLPRMNEELARLFEQYYQETQGSGAVGKAPAVHRVIPVDEAISFDLEVFPYERATELIENSKSWGVRKCICRVQQRLIGKGCDHPVENCLVHSAANNQGQIFYICNCCTCCCGVIRGLTEFDNPMALARSDFRSVVDAELCTGCGECVERCPFEALAVPEELCVVNYDRCVGCGLCASVCPTQALSLKRRSEGEMPKTPVDQNEWMAQRAQERGINISEVL